MKILRDNEKGQALLEFALVLPLLLLLVVGIIDFGMIFFKWLAVEHTARDAARYASLGGSTRNAKALATSELQTAGMQNANVNVSVAPYTPPSSTGQTGNGSNPGTDSGTSSGNNPSGWSENQWLQQWLSFLQGLWSGNQQGNWPGNLPEPWWSTSGGGAESGGSDDGGPGSGASGSGSSLQLNQVTVSINYPMSLFDPIMSAILGNPFPIHSTVTMLVEPSGNAAPNPGQGSGGNQGGQGGNSGSNPGGNNETSDKSP